jgi:prepilin peptidase CpaA
MTFAHLSPGDVALVAVLSISAATDLRVGRIFNAVTYPAILLGLSNAAVGNGPEMGSAIAGCVLGGLALYSLFACGCMGGGDVKLMAAVGAFKGAPFIMSALFYSIFLGGVAAALVLIWGGHARAVVSDMAAIGRRLRTPGVIGEAIPSRGGALPFGVAICLGTLAAMAL